MSAGAPLRGITLLRDLGRTIGASLHLARRNSDGREVGLQLLDPGLAALPGFTARLAGVAAQIAPLRHPRVVGTEQVIVGDRGAALLVEPVAGVPLSSLLTEGEPLSLAEAAAVVDDVLRGVSAAHAAGVVHCGICPERVLLPADGEARLDGFAMARALALTGGDPGTPLPGYSSPERLGGALPDGQGDLWAAAALAHRLLTGRPPQEGEVAEVAALPALTPLLRRALDPDPARRFPTAAALRSALLAPVAEQLGSDWRRPGLLTSRLAPALLTTTTAPARRTGMGSVAPVPPPPSARAATGGADAAAAAGQPNASLAAAAAISRGAVPAAAGPAAASATTAPSASTPPPAAAASAWAASTPPDAPRDAGIAAAAPLPPYPDDRHRHRRRRLALALLVLLLLAGAGAAAAVIVTRNLGDNGLATPIGPLRVGKDLKLTVQKTEAGACSTDYAVTATGSLTGQGTLTYHWEQTGTGGGRLADQSIPITDQVGLGIVEHFRYQGHRSGQVTFTFVVTAPQPTSVSTVVDVTC